MDRLELFRNSGPSSTKDTEQLLELRVRIGVQLDSEFQNIESRQLAQLEAELLQVAYDVWQQIKHELDKLEGQLHEFSDQLQDRKEPLLRIVQEGRERFDVKFQELYQATHRLKCDLQLPVQRKRENLEERLQKFELRLRHAGASQRRPQLEQLQEIERQVQHGAQSERRRLERQVRVFKQHLRHQLSNQWKQIEPQLKELQQLLQQDVENFTVPSANS